MLFKYLNLNHLKPLNKSYSYIQEVEEKLETEIKNNSKIMEILKPKIQKLKNLHSVLRNQAKEIIEETYSSKFLIEDVDITKNRDLFRKFKLDIPVFYYNGEFLMKHRVDLEAL